VPQGLLRRSDRGSHVLQGRGDAANLGPDLIDAGADAGPPMVRSAASIGALIYIDIHIQLRMRVSGCT
jgi:hypothetical protein